MCNCCERLHDCICKDVNYALVVKEKTARTYQYSYPISGLDIPLGLQEVQAPIISRQLAHDGFQPYILAPFIPQRISLVLISASSPGP